MLVPKFVVVSAEPVQEQFVMVPADESTGLIFRQVDEEVQGLRRFAPRVHIVAKEHHVVAGLNTGALHYLDKRTQAAVDITYDK
jgi:hypothetical protein